MRGNYRGHEILAFDYHYETDSTDSKGHRNTNHHWFSFYLLFLPRSVPDLTIVPEGIFSKIAQAFGYDDIDFESAEFSRKFCVRSADKKFAYDICNSRMIEYLLQLKADQPYLQLQKELVNTEDRIQAARRFYNGNVRDYQVKCQSFLTNLIAQMGGFQPAEYFSVPPSIREVPNVDF
jgi:hypothetical protein